MTLLPFPLTQSVEALDKLPGCTTEKLELFVEMLDSRNLAHETSYTRKLIVVMALAFGDEESLRIRETDCTNRLGKWLQSIPQNEDEDDISPEEEYSLIETCVGNMVSAHGLMMPLLIWDPAVKPTYEDAVYGQQLQLGLIEPKPTSAELHEKDSEPEAPVKPTYSGWFRRPANDPEPSR